MVLDEAAQAAEVEGLFFDEEAEGEEALQTA
jgi:hypothetical protein